MYNRIPALLLAALLCLGGLSLAAHAETPPLDTIPADSTPIVETVPGVDYSGQLAAIESALAKIEENTRPSPSPEPTPEPDPTEEPPTVFEIPFSEYSVTDTLLLSIFVLGVIAALLYLFKK